MADPIIGKISVGDGATFTPAVSNEGVLSWSNNKNLANPADFDIPGKVLEQGVDLLGLAPIASPAFTGTPTAPTPGANDNSTKLATTAYVQGVKTEVNAYTDEAKAEANAYTDEQIRQHGNVPVGFEYFSMNPNIPQGSLPLLGGEYNRSTYSDLWAWVQEQTGYLKTEAEWQALSTANNGNVPYYSDGDGSTTFRVPSLQCWVRGANGSVGTVGSYLAAGLPNITGQIDLRNSNYENSKIGFPKSGAIYDGGNTSSANSDSWTQNDTDSTQTLVKFDASRSSSIYGNSTTVQPESIVGLWLVKAYGTIVDTGTIDEQQYIDDRIAALPNTFLPLAGGTMVGTVIHSNSLAIKRNVDDSNLVIEGASAYDKGAYLQLYGKDSANSAAFALVANDGTNAFSLVGSPNGALKWNNNNVITSELTGNVLSAYGTSSTIGSNAELCSVTNHNAGLWLIVGHVDLNFVMNDGKAYNNAISTQSHGQRNVRSTGYNGGGSMNVWLLSLNTNEKVSLMGYCPSGSGSMRGTLQMVQLA